MSPSPAPLAVAVPRARLAAGRLAVTSLLLPLLLAASAVAQERGEGRSSDSAFEDVIEVELINVRVWVSDRDGRPVSGLGIQDFTVEVDGEPVTLTHFSESRDGVTGEMPEMIESYGAPEGTPTAAPAAAPDVESRFVLYIDELHSSLRGRRRLIEDLRQMVDEGELPAADILILRQAADLRPVLSFGASVEEVDAALEALLEPQPIPSSASQDKRAAVARIWQLWEEAQLLAGPDPCRFFTRDGEQEALVYAQRAASRAQVTLGHLEEASSFLAGVDGFKALLYVGDVLEVRPGEDLMQIVQGICPGRTETLQSDIASEQLSKRFSEVAERANAGQVTIYALQVSGLRPSGFGGADQKSTDARVSGPFELAARTSNRDGLEQLALQTGGEAIVGRNNLADAISGVAEDLGSYYSLGFAPPEDRGDTGYRLDIDVRGDGLRVRHRNGLQRRTTRQEMEQQVMSAIYLGESRNPLGIRLGSGTLRQVSEGVMVVPLFIRVPADEVLFLPGADGDMAELEVMVATRSPEHRGTPPVSRLYRVARPEASGAFLDLAVELQLAPGTYVLGIGVRDRAAARRSFVSTSIAVGPGEEP